MRNYAWNIRNWLGRIIGRRRNSEEFLSFAFCLLKPVQDLADELASESVRWRRNILYSSQQGVLQSLLNQIFDPTEKRIKVVTIADLVPDVIIYHDGEVEPIEQLLYFDVESESSPIVYQDGETDGLADYKIIVPVLLNSEESKIVFWVNRYNLADKKYQIEYE